MVDYRHRLVDVDERIVPDAEMTRVIDEVMAPRREMPGEITMIDRWNVVPMNPPVSTVDLRSDEIIEMLEENMERTYAHDPYEQMGGYLKRMAGAKAYLRVENPRGHGIQRVYVCDQLIRPERTYQAVFVTAQAVGPRYGTSQSDIGDKAIEVLKRYIAGHNPVDTGLRETFVLV